MNNLDFGLTYALPALAAAAAVGMIGVAALNALGRNPEKASDIRSMMITAIVFADSLAIIALIAAIVARFV